MAAASKIDEVLAEIGKRRAAGRKIVFTNGCFDILHVGHVRYLAEARSLGDYLIVGVNSDESVKLLKGPARPINGEEDRAEMLLALKSVDAAIIYSEETPYNLISLVQPDVLVKGGDWAIDKIIGADLVLARGGQVKSLAFIEGRSTTAVIEKVLGAQK